MHTEYIHNPKYGKVYSNMVFLRAYCTLYTNTILSAGLVWLAAY